MCMDCFQGSVHKSHRYKVGDLSRFFFFFFHFMDSINMPAKYYVTNFLLAHCKEVSKWEVVSMVFPDAPIVRWRFL